MQEFSFEKKKKFLLTREEIKKEKHKIETCEL